MPDQAQGALCRRAGPSAGAAGRGRDGAASAAFSEARQLPQRLQPERQLLQSVIQRQLRGAQGRQLPQRLQPERRLLPCRVERAARRAEAGELSQRLFAKRRLLSEQQMTAAHCKRQFFSDAKVYRQNILATIPGERRIGLHRVVILKGL